MGRGFLLASVVLLSGCAVLTESASFETAANGCGDPTLLFSISGGSGDIGTTSVASVARIAPPLTSDEPRAFNLTSTIPLKIRVEDCEGNADNSQSPLFSLEQVEAADGGPAGGAVSVIVSSSEVDAGNTLRSAGDGQYLFNLSTLLSGFTTSGDLTPGLYRLTVTGGFDNVVVDFKLR